MKITDRLIDFRTETRRRRRNRLIGTPLVFVTVFCTFRTDGTAYECARTVLGTFSSCAGSKGGVFRTKMAASQIYKCQCGIFFATSSAAATHKCSNEIKHLKKCFLCQNFAMERL